MIYVGIDVAKDKHDCFITNSDGEVLFKAFTITNNLDGFNDLYQKIETVMKDITKVKVGLEATGHYSYNLLGYLIDKGLPTYVINPLHTGKDNIKCERKRKPPDALFFYLKSTEREVRTCETTDI